ncbi:MAG: hypothetical protein Aurels2KO_25320 [Aureliella sp.]
MEGRKNKIYLNTGTFGTPVWSEMDRITGLKRPQNRGSSEYQYRGAKNKKTAVGYRKFELSFKYETKRNPANADAILALLQDSYDNETVLDMATVDRAIATTGATGVRGPVQVTTFDRDEDDESNTSYDVTLSEVDHEESDVLVEIEAYTTA